MKLGEIKKIFGATHLTTQDDEREPLAYSIDSRTIRNGEMFFAIRGENHDGHRFVADVIKKGAIAAVVSKEFFESAESKAGLIPVDDTLKALQSLASSLLRQWNGKLIAITGSMGKTTTKDMTAMTMARAGRVIKTTGNLNNEFGLPLSILRMESGGSHASNFDFAVFEMGMNHKGEIAQLARIAPPNFAVVTNVAAVHLEFFPSLDAIGEAKAELIEGLRSEGAAALNADDPRVIRMREKRNDIEYRTFGIENKADVMARDIKLEGLDGAQFTLETRQGAIEIDLASSGRHNIYNALAAAAVGDYYGIDLQSIASALAENLSAKMRGEVIRFKEEFTIVNDSYNSNPTALIEMARTIASDKDGQRKIVVAGEMLELGDTAPALHRQSGRGIAQLGVDILIGVRGLAGQIVAGAREAGMSDEVTIFCQTPEDGAELLSRIIRAGDLVLVKGSRGVKTEIVIEKMKERFEVNS
jgi:UDP-N-acetylmuramoyl-tripeptide--D-alanyl-D-alanine ligase